MIGFWFYKFEIEDRDIGVVDFVPIGEGTDIKQPSVALCFKAPFLDEKVGKIIPKIDEDSYLRYLKGDYYNKSIEMVPYNNITFDLGDYFLYATERLRNHSVYRNSSLSIEHTEIFSGFFLTNFIKCFSLRFDIDTNGYLQAIQFYYDVPKLILDWRPDIINAKFLKTLIIYAKIHYPGQFFLGENPKLFFGH